MPAGSTMIQTTDFQGLQNRVVASKYRLKRWLGGSPRTAVYETDVAGRKAAIKIVLQEAGSEVSLERLQKLSGFSHPNLIQVFDSGWCEFDGAKFIYVVMEFAEEDLSQILPQRPLTPAETRDFLQPVLSALLYLHEKGFVHGRVRPSNILAAGDCIKVSTDFGLESSRDRDPYDAPESRSSALSASADVWGAGATICAALTQHPPIVDGGSKRDPEIPPSIPEPFRTIALECLRCNPGERCSMARIAALLRGDAIAEEPLAAVSAPSESDGQRSRLLLISAAVAALIVVLFLIFHFSGGSNAPVDHQSAQKTASSPSAVPASQPETTPAPSANSRGSILHKVVPEVPNSARRTIHGHIKVAVRVMVDARGKVTSEKLVTAGPSQYFANLAARAAEKWEFTAPVSNGQATPSTWLLRFQFSRKNTEVSPTQEHR